MKPELLDKVSKKYSNTKFHENPSRASRVAPCGRTDAHKDKQDKPTHLKIAPPMYSQDNNYGALT